jgi:hypothetical protein
VGVKVAATTQLEAAVSVDKPTQFVPLDGVASAKSPAFVPPSITLVIVIDALPVLVSVTVICPLVTPVFSFPKAIVEPLKVATGWIAVPLKETMCGLPESGESEMVRLAARLVPPDAPGVNITFVTHDPVVFGKLAPLVHVFVPSVKSLAFVPVMEGVPETLTAPEVGLLSVTGCGELGKPTV